MANQKNKPVDTVKLAGIIGSIWRNETASGPRYAVTFSRLYKDGDEWKRTESYSRDQALLLYKVADLAHTRIFELQAEDNESNDSESEAA